MTLNLAHGIVFHVPVSGIVFQVDGMHSLLQVPGTWRHVPDSA